MGSVIPLKLFRFFLEERHANRLAEGHVWLSTLEACRRYEEAGRGDQGEASVTYLPGTITGDGDDPALQLVAQRCQAGGVSLFRFDASCRNITIANVSVTTTVPNAYVVCATRDLLADDNVFGKYCVEISQPVEVFRRITGVLRNERRISQAVIDRVHYRPRTFSGLLEPPGRIGFVKPINYASQREVRMMWRPDPPTEELMPLELYCPEIVKLCRRIR